MAPSLGPQDSIISNSMQKAPSFVTWAAGLGIETVSEDFFWSKNRTKVE